MQYSHLLPSSQHSKYITDQSMFPKKGGKISKKTKVIEWLLKEDSDLRDQELWAKNLDKLYMMSMALKPPQMHQVKS